MISHPLYQAAPRTKMRMPVKKYPGIAGTVKFMVGLGNVGQRDPSVRRWAEETVREVTPRDYLSEMAALYYRACREIRYTRDPTNTELLFHPAVVLKSRAADCDDFATLLRAAFAAAGLSIGNDMQFVTVGFGPGAAQNGIASHVYLRVRHPELGWLVVDPVAGPHTREMLKKVTYHKGFST